VTEERTFSREIEGRTLEISTGLLALNTAASCTIRFGDTMVLATVCDGEAREGIDFFPLTVDFEERMYAIGKIPGSFFRREGRPGNEATLAARMTDRPIRPLFPKGFRREVQVVLTLLSSDRDTPADIFGTTGASTVLGMSHIPFAGPVSSVRIARLDGAFKAFPTYAEMDESDLDLIVAGTSESVVMIEAGAKEVPEDVIIEAIEYARGIIAQLNDLQREIVEAVGVAKASYAPAVSDEALTERVRAALQGEDERMLGAVTEEGFRGIDELATLATEKIADPEVTKQQVRRVIEDVLKPFVRNRILHENKRADGRHDEELRQLDARVGLIPRSHGSGLFRRGGTQVLSVATLGPLGDRQRLDNISPQQFKRYLHHYNFPPFSVGEARPLRGPGRREIGHGMLSERAVEPMLPTFDDFPYTIRVVSDTLMSNGSSSMASVCGSTLALMDAGVPIKEPVAGVAMGLVTEEGSSEYRVLTDIAGIEDAFGDMDFKVAGTRNGITAVQLDIKLKSLPADLFQRVFERARTARLKILDTLHAAIAQPRAEVSQYAPMITTIHIDPEKIGLVIGPRGATIQKIVAESGSTIDVEDDGSVFIAGPNGDSVKKAVSMIEGLTKEVKVGDIYEGKVSRIMTFGAFVEILPGKDGLVHISDLAYERVERVEDVLNVGDTVRVQVVEIDNLNRINLSRKALLDGDGEGGVGMGEEALAAARERGGDRGDRGPRDGGRDRRGGGGGGRGGYGGGRRDGGGDRGPRPDNGGPRGERPPRSEPSGDRGGEGDREGGFGGGGGYGPSNPPSRPTGGGRRF